MPTEHSQPSVTQYTSPHWYILPYHRGSKSARALGQALGIPVLTKPNKRRADWTINWGCGSNHPSVSRLYSLHNDSILGTINDFDCVDIAKNKLQCFHSLDLAGVPTVQATAEMGIANSWLASGDRVYERHILGGQRGHGIRVVAPGEQLTQAPLYTRHIKKCFEFRVHVFQDRMIDYSQKKRRANSADPPNEYIRNHNNGWVFCRRGVTLPPEVRDTCIKAVHALGLDFGGVDVLYSPTRGTFVLEVNTAPGLENTSLQAYANAFRTTLMVG